MNTRQTEFLNGYVMSKITEYFAVDRDRIIDEVADDVSSLFASKSVAEKHVSRAVNQLESMGFIATNEANNITQNQPAIAFRENMGEGE